MNVNQGAKFCSSLEQVSNKQTGVRVGILASTSPLICAYIRSGFGGPC